MSKVLKHFTSFDALSESSRSIVLHVLRTNSPQEWAMEQRGETDRRCLPVFPGRARVDTRTVPRSFTCVRLVARQATSWKGHVGE